MLMIIAKHLFKDHAKDFIHIYLFNPYNIFLYIVLILYLFYGDTLPKDWNPDPFNFQALWQHFSSVCLTFTTCQTHRNIYDFLSALFHSLILSLSLPLLHFLFFLLLLPLLPLLQCDKVRNHR